MAFSHLDESLQSHGRTILFKVLNIAKGLSIRYELHNVTAKVRCCRCDKLGDKNGDLVLEQLLLVSRIVHIVHIYRDVDVEWFQQAMMIYTHIST